MPNRFAIEDLAVRLVRPHHGNDDHWSKVLAIALQGQSFSDIQRRLKGLEVAAISGDRLEFYLQSLFQLESLSKSDRKSNITSNPISFSC